MKVLRKQKSREIESLEELIPLLQKENNLVNIAFQDLDLESIDGQLKAVNFSHCIFLGCRLSESLKVRLLNNGNLVFPLLDVPYNPYRARLYSVDRLYRDYDPAVPESYERTPDFRIYQYYQEKGRYYPDSIYETLAQKLHDHSITDALMDIIENLDERRIVAVMGGHGLVRNSGDYRKISRIAKTLVEKGYFLLSGGGPGAMEATHLGAWMAGRNEEELEMAIRIVSEAPHYRDRWWLSKAFEVREEFPKLSTLVTDIGIPTWLYGHEPATPFASLIAKYFENSIREEGLLALAFGGIIYTPGSAGTIQEIFQDATQNHYKSYEMASPMVFLNANYWNEVKPVYPLLYKLAEGKEYQKWLGIYDKESDILDHLFRFSGAEGGAG